MCEKMLISIFNILIFTVIFVDAGALDGPHHPCGLNEQECHRKFFQKFGSYYSKIGIKEIGLPILDPLQLRNVTISVPNLFNVTLVKGESFGVAECITTSYETFIENKTKTSDLICKNITITGEYKLALGPYITNTLGNIIHGNGHIRVELQNWYFKLVYPFVLEKRKNDDIYMKILFEKTKYETTLDNVMIDVQNVTLGDQDISPEVNSILNKNWRIFGPTFGKTFTDKSLQYYYDAHNLFFNSAPTKFYIAEDLRQYL